MSIDPTRATFVQKEYRYETVEDLAVLIAYPLALNLQLDTNLDSAAAASLAVTMFAYLKKNNDGYEAIIEGILPPSLMDGSQLCWYIKDPKYSEDGSKVYRLVECGSSWGENFTKMVLVG